MRRRNGSRLPEGEAASLCRINPDAGLRASALHDPDGFGCPAGDLVITAYDCRLRWAELAVPMPGRNASQPRPASSGENGYAGSTDTSVCFTLRVGYSF